MVAEAAEELLCKNCRAKLSEPLATCPKDARLKLWKKWFEIDENRSRLTKARELIAQDSAFCEDVARAAGRRLLNDKDTFETAETMLALSSSAVIRARVTHRQWLIRRKRGTHRAATKLQSALHRFHQYLESYSGVVEIVKQGGQEFGVIAYSTMSIFLVIAKNKTDEEESLTKALDTLGQETDRMTRLCYCIPSERAGTMILQFYIATIELAREAIRYFASSSYGRLWTTIRGSPTNFLQDKLSEIERSIKSIEKEAEAVAVENSTKLLALYKEERNYRNQKRVSTLRKRLCPDGTRLNKLQEYSDKFFLRTIWPKKYEEFDLDKVLSRDAVFQRWMEEDSSRILLLHGLSNIRRNYHWLSAAALTLVKTLEEEAKTSGAAPLYAFLHPDLWLPDNLYVPQASLVSSLIWQYLGHFPEVSEDFAFHEYLETMIERTEWRTDDACELQYHVLQQLLERRTKSYLILDRLDSCDCPVYIALGYLLKLIGECQKSVVKILVVVDTKPFEIGKIVSPYKSKLTVMRRDQGRRSKSV